MVQVTSGGDGWFKLQSGGEFPYCAWDNRVEWRAPLTIEQPTPNVNQRYPKRELGQVGL